EPAHLQDRLTAQTENTGRFTTTAPFNENEVPDGGIDFHGKHSRPIPKGTSLPNGRILCRPHRHHGGAPWPNLSPPCTHWEGDLILGLGSSAIGTLVERTTRFTMLLHLPLMEGHGKARSIRNGPALAGHGAKAIRDAISETIMDLPAHLRRSLTWDQG